MSWQKKNKQKKTNRQTNIENLNKTRPVPVPKFLSVKIIRKLIALKCKSIDSFSHNNANSYWKLFSNRALNPQKTQGKMVGSSQNNEEIQIVLMLNPQRNHWIRYPET